MLKRVVAMAATLMLGVATPALAAPPAGPSGTIELAGSAVEAVATSQVTSPAFGDSVGFNVTVEGRISSKATVYVTVVCSQGSTVVYQWSGAPDFSFPLVDQAGQGLEWDSTAASCEAKLIYHIKKGRGYSNTVLDSTSFDVVGG